MWRLLGGPVTWYHSRVSCSWGAIAVLAVLAPALSGCSGVDQGAATEAAQQFYAAVQQRDGDAACTLLMASTRSELEQSAGKPCPAAILDEDIPTPNGPGATVVFGTMAQVRYPGETAFLTRSGQGWRVLAVSCGDRPEGPERPYDCQVKGD